MRNLRWKAFFFLTLFYRSLLNTQPQSLLEDCTGNISECLVWSCFCQKGAGSCLASGSGPAAKAFPKKTYLGLAQIQSRTHPFFIWVGVEFSHPPWTGERILKGHPTFWRNGIEAFRMKPWMDAEGFGWAGWVGQIVCKKPSFSLVFRYSFIHSLVLTG